MSITKTTDGDVEIVTLTGPDLAEFKANLTKTLHGETAPGCCVSCKDQFGPANVFTAAGWRETQLSGMCERCWDETFADEDDEQDD